MNLFTKVIRGITHRNSRTMLLTLHRKCSVDQNSSSAPTEAMSTQLHDLSNKFIAQTKQQYEANQKYLFGDVPLEDIISEDIHSRRFFESSLHYTNLIIPAKPQKILIKDEQVKQLYDTNWDTATEDDIIGGLRILSHIDRTDELQEILLKILNSIQNNCSNYQDNAIIEILKGLVHVQHNEYTLPNNNAFRRCIDKECLKRFIKAPIPQRLQICYILQYIQIFRSLSFTQLSLTKLGDKPQKLTSKNLVLLLFMINTHRRAPINMYELEYRLEQCKDELCVTELSIAALGFFKSRTTIKNLSLVNYIVDEAIKNVHNLDSVTISAIMKIIRHNLQLQSLLKVSNLMIALKSRLADVHLMSITHIAEMFVALSFHRIDTLRLIVKRLKQDIKEARIKDLERICMCLCHCNYIEDTSIYTLIIDEITERLNGSEITDVEIFRISLPRILASMAQINIYSHALTRRVMHEQYIREVCKGNFNKLDYCYCYLNYSIQIDDPTYDGPLLNRLISNLQVKALESLNSTLMMHKPAKQLAEIFYYCKEVVNSPDAVCVDHFLPHYANRDILIGLDSNKRPVPIVPILRSIPIHTLKRVNEHLPEGTNLIVLVIGTHQHEMRGTAPVGSFILAKVRHLKRVGCTPHIVWHEEWGNDDSDVGKKNLVKKLLYSDNISEQF